MSLLWFDGFETYTDRNEMLEGAYTSVGAGTFDQTNIVTNNVRHGSRAYQCGYNSGDGAPSFRKALGASYDVVGVGGAYFFNQLSSRGLMYIPMDFRSSTNTIQFSIFVDPMGRVVARRTASDAAVATTTQVIFPRRWHHIEARCKCHLTAGEIEVRVDGETVILETNINTRDDTVTAGIAFVAANRRAEGSNFGTFKDFFVVDDFFIWNDQGSDHTTFIGDRGVHTLAPTADTSVAEFDEIVGTGAGYEAINDVLPDDDVTYIVADALAGSVETASEFDFADLPATVQVVEGLATIARMRDSGGGGCDMQLSLMSDASEAAGSIHALTSSWAFYTSLMSEDPATSDPWEPSAVNAAQLRIARV